MTRDRILESAALEIERNGLTQFRVKRVASEAGISVALLYSYFSDREDLIAATIVHRFRRVLLGQAEIFTTPLRNVETAEDLRAALRVMIADAQTPERDEGRILRIESISFAHHNLTASAGIAAAKQETSAQIMEIVRAPASTGVVCTRARQRRCLRSNLVRALLRSDSAGGRARAFHQLRGVAEGAQRSRRFRRPPGKRGSSRLSWLTGLVAATMPVQPPARKNETASAPSTDRRSVDGQLRGHGEWQSHQSRALLGARGVDQLGAKRSPLRLAAATAPDLHPLLAGRFIEHVRHEHQVWRLSLRPSTTTASSAVTPAHLRRPDEVALAGDNRALLHGPFLVGGENPQRPCIARPVRTTTASVQRRRIRFTGLRTLRERPDLARVPPRAPQSPDHVTHVPYRGPCPSNSPCRSPSPPRDSRTSRRARAVPARLG